MVIFGILLPIAFGLLFAGILAARLPIKWWAKLLSAVIGFLLALLAWMGTTFVVYDVLLPQAFDARQYARVFGVAILAALAASVWGAFRKRHRADH